MSPWGPTGVAWVVVIRQHGLFWAGYSPLLVTTNASFSISLLRKAVGRSAYVSFSLLVQHTSPSSMRWAPSMVFNPCLPRGQHNKRHLVWINDNDLSDNRVPYLHSKWGPQCHGRLNSSSVWVTVWSYVLISVLNICCDFIYGISTEDSKVSLHT